MKIQASFTGRYIGVAFQKVAYILSLKHPVYQLHLVLICKEYLGKAGNAEFAIVKVKL